MPAAENGFQILNLSYVHPKKHRKTNKNTFFNGHLSKLYQKQISDSYSTIQKTNIFKVRYVSFLNFYTVKNTIILAW